MVLVKIIPILMDILTNGSQTNTSTQIKYNTSVAPRLRSLIVKFFQRHLY
jgi:hypothetical protein